MHPDNPTQELSLRKCLILCLFIVVWIVMKSGSKIRVRVIILCFGLISGYNFQGFIWVIPTIRFTLGFPDFSGFVTQYVSLKCRVSGLGSHLWVRVGFGLFPLGFLGIGYPTSSLGVEHENYPVALIGDHQDEMKPKEPDVSAHTSEIRSFC